MNASWKWKRWPDKRGWRSPAKSHPLSPRTESNPREISFPVLILKAAVLGLYESFFLFFSPFCLGGSPQPRWIFTVAYRSPWLGGIIIFVFVIKLLRLLLLQAFFFTIQLSSLNDDDENFTFQWLNVPLSVHFYLYLLIFILYYTHFYMLFANNTDVIKYIQYINIDIDESFSIFVVARHDEFLWLIEEGHNLCFRYKLIGFFTIGVSSLKTRWKFYAPVVRYFMHF